MEVPFTHHCASASAWYCVKPLVHPGLSCVQRLATAPQAFLANASRGECAMWCHSLARRKLPARAVPSTPPPSQDCLPAEIHELAVPGLSACTPGPAAALMWCLVPAPGGIGWQEQKQALAPRLAAAQPNPAGESIRARQARRPFSGTQRGRELEKAFPASREASRNPGGLQLLAGQPGDTLPSLPCAGRRLANGYFGWRLSSPQQVGIAAAQGGAR